MENLKRIQKEYAEFCKINSVNLAEKCRRVPSEKHYFITILIDSKIKRSELIKTKKEITKLELDRIYNESPVKLSSRVTPSIESPKITEIDNKIEEIDFLIEYLEHVAKSISYIDQSFKNIIETEKLQLL